MSKIDTVRAAMMQAMKDKNKERKDALSLLLSALKSKQIDKRADLTEEEENAVIFREISRHRRRLTQRPRIVHRPLRKPGCACRSTANLCPS